MARELGLEHPATNNGWGVRITSLRDETVGDTATVLWVLLGAVGLVLLVACANVALLSLIRGRDRSGEAAIRIALGASAGRLLREFLMESVLLATLGGVLVEALSEDLRRSRESARRERPRRQIGRLVVVGEDEQGRTVVRPGDRVLANAGR